MQRIYFHFYLRFTALPSCETSKNIAAKVLVEGLSKAGKSLSRESLVDALSNLSTIDLGDFALHYAPDNHNGSTYVDLTIVNHNGTFKH